MQQQVDVFYSASTALLVEKKEEYYLQLLDLKGVDKLKLYLCKIIPQEFQYFPQAQEKALNVQWDLCEDDDISIRKEAIKYLPDMAGAFASRIADVLWQFMQSDYEDELLVVKNALQRVLLEYTSETVDAFFHQILNTPDVRDRAIDFLVLNYPRASKDSKIVEKLLMSMDSIEYTLEQVLKIFKFSRDFNVSIALKEKMVEKITAIHIKTHDSKEILQRANACLGFFKEGVSSRIFLEFLYKIWKSIQFLDVQDAKLVHLHILMLFSDLIGFQKSEGEYISLFPDILKQFYSLGLKFGNSEDKTTFFMAEPIVYCIYQIVCTSPDRYVADNELLMVFRQMFATSQSCRDELLNKLRNLEQKGIKTVVVLKDIKQLKKQYRSALNVFNMIREVLKPQSARRKLIISPSWKPEPIERARAPSDTTLVSSSSVLKRKNSVEESTASHFTGKTKLPESTGKKSKPSKGKNNDNILKKQKTESKPHNKPKKQEKNIAKSKKTSEVSQIVIRKNLVKPQVPKSINSLAIAGTASRMIQNSSQLSHSPRQVSLLRPTAASAGAAMFQRAANAVQTGTNIPSFKRIVTFGPQTSLI